MRQTRVQRRRVDREERAARRAAEHHQCYRHALRGERGVRATHGELCKDCFDHVTFNRKW